MINAIIIDDEQNNIDNLAFLLRKSVVTYILWQQLWMWSTGKS